MNTRNIRERKHRLDPICYRGNVAVVFTACEKTRQLVFAREEVVRIFERVLIDEMRAQQCEALVYMFMPDHLHVLAHGGSANADTLKAMRMFKQKTGYWLSQRIPEFQWQKDFYDHILRDEREIPKHVKYILENPVRKALVSDWKTYPYRGSTIYNLDEWD